MRMTLSTTFFLKCHRILNKFYSTLPIIQEDRSRGFSLKAPNNPANDLMKNQKRYSMETSIELKVASFF